MNIYVCGRIVAAETDINRIREREREMHFIKEIGLACEWTAKKISVNGEHH